MISITGMKLLLCAMSLAAMVAVSGCSDTKGDQPSAEVNITFAEPEAIPPILLETAPAPLCPVGDNSFQSSSNFQGDPQNGYHGIMWRCHAEVKIELAIWGADDVLFGLASSQCPTLDIGPLDGRYALPAISYDNQRMAQSISDARHFLASELQDFRQECGLPAIPMSFAFEGFDELLEAELAKAWIKHRYAELLGDRIFDENLRKQAIADYARR